MPNTERLLNVARACRETKFPDQFTMKCFARDECGSPGCALGNYAVRHDLQDAFSLRYAEKNGGTAQLVRRDDEYNTFLGYDSREVVEHFGLTKGEAGVLFGEDGCGDARVASEAAAYIEQWAAEYPNVLRERAGFVDEDERDEDEDGDE